MKRLVLLLVVCTIPILLFLNVWQVHRFTTSLDEVRALEKAQRNIIEENKRTLIGIEVLSSPSRIEEIVSELEDLSKRERAPRILIQVSESGTESNGD